MILGLTARGAHRKFGQIPETPIQDNLSRYSKRQVVYITMLSYLQMQFLCDCGMGNLNFQRMIWDLGIKVCEVLATLTITCELLRMQNLRSHPRPAQSQCAFQEDPQ